MIMMQGNDRIFDKVVIEGGTAAARTISLYGVKALSDLQGVSLIVRANIGGSSSATTMKVNNLTATKLSVFKNGGIADADANWIVSGQLYMLYYDGVQFIAFPMSASSGSSSSSVEFADFPVDVLNLPTQSSETDISSAFGGAAKVAEFDALVQAGTKIIRFTNVDSFVYYTAIYYKHINAGNSTINDIVVVLHNYTDKTDLEMFTFLGTMTEDGDFEKYTALVKETLYSSSQEGTLNNPRAFTGDANTKTTPGVYAITPFSNVPKNIPSGVSYGTMIVTTDEDASTITQTLQTSNTVYFRCKYSTNNWGEWVDLGASGGGSSSGGMKTFEITYDDLEDILNAKSESAILAIWNDTEQGEFVEAMNDPNTIIVIKYTDDQYITDRQYVVYKTGFYNGIGYSVAQTQYINLITVTGSYLYNYKFNFNFDTEHISSVTRSSIDLSKIEDEMIVETDQATSLSFDNQTGNRGILAVSGNSEQETRSGKNTVDINSEEVYKTGNTQYQVEEDTVTVSGSGLSTIYASLPLKLKKNTDYTISCIATVLTFSYESGELNPDIRIRQEKNSGGIIGSSQIITIDKTLNVAQKIKSTFNSGDNETVWLWLYLSSRNNAQKSVSIKFEDLQIEEGTKQTEYEKYGESPSSQFPSPIKRVGDNINLINEENLLNYTPYGATVTSTVIQASTTRRGYLFECKPNTAYTIQRGDTTAPSFRGFCFDENPIENPQAKSTNGAYADTLAGPVGKKITFKTTANSKYIYVVTSTNEYTTPSVKAEEGNIATSYSPYNCGNIGVNKTNSNILPQFEETKESQTINGITITKNSDGTYTLNGTSTGIVDLILFGSWTSEGVKLRLNKGILYFKTNSTKINGSINCFSKSINKSFSINVNSYFNNQVVEDVSYVFIRLCTGAGVTFNNENVVLELSYDDVDNLEVNKNEKIVFPLEEGQRLMLGDYPGSDKKIHHVRKQISLDETKDWKQSSVISSVFYLDLEENITQDTTKFSLICNQYVYGGILEDTVSNAKNNEIYGFISNSTLLKRIVLRNDNFTDLQSFKNSLSEQKGIPLILEFNLAEEETEDFTEEQKTAFEQLQNCDMYKPVTNITTEENMALLQMTLVDSYLNNVIEASISIVNSDSIVGTILNPKTLTSSDDLNNIKTSGTYTYTTSSSPSNTPNGTSYGTLMVNKISDNEITQTVISPDFSEGSSSKSSNIWFRDYGTRPSNQQSGVPEWSDWSLLLMSDYGNRYRYMKPYLLSYYDFNSLDSDSTQTDIENAFGSLEDEQEFIAAMNDENTNIILYYDHESNEREYWYTISKMVDNGKYHRLVLCRGNSSENMTAGSISFIIYSFKYDETNNVYTAFNREQIGVSSDGRKH